jgi:hypothetical protein
VYVEEIGENTVDVNFLIAVVLHVTKYCALMRSGYVFIYTINILMKCNIYFVLPKKYLFLFCICCQFAS